MSNFDDLSLKNIKSSVLEDDTTFNRLFELQTLLKKESAMKDLFIKTGEETKKNINQQCIDIHKKKIEVLNILQKLNKERPKINNPDKKSNTNLLSELKEYTLVENNQDYLSELNIYIPKLLNYVWDDPKLVVNLLLNADKEDTKKYLAPLICNNFYENILSSNYIEDPLMYVIYILLDNEINNIKDIQNSDSFLNETPCSYLLSQLIEKKDVKDFFKIILENILEDLGSNKYNFNIGQIEENFIQKKNSINKLIFDTNIMKVDKNKEEKEILKEASSIIEEENLATKGLFSSFSNSISSEKELMNIMRESQNYKLFHSKYLRNISYDYLEQKKNEEFDFIFEDYYNYLISNANNNKQAYYQDCISNSIAKTKNSVNILVLYQQDFFRAIDFIDKLFNNLNDNYRIIPYSIKFVCRIIYKLVKSKFPDANYIQQNLLISKFFFKHIFIPILLKPDINALINNYIISNNIIHNVEIISKIILKFVSFELYKDEPNLKGEIYTPFNIFFLDKIPQLFEFYGRITKVKLPNFINDFINKKIIIENYNFDYFKENQNEVLFHRSILLNIDEFNAIYKTLINNVDNKNMDLKKLMKTLNKIKNDAKSLDKLLKPHDYTPILKDIKSTGILTKKKNVIEEKKNIIKYFHISELLFNDKYKQLFSLEKKIPYHHIKEIKETKEITNKELINKNNIIKAKNFISSILYNYRILVKSDFNIGTINNTFNILKELKLFMKTSNFLIDGNIPSDWHVSALIECLQKLPDEYKENDYEKLYNELTDELKISIKEYNFEYMSIFIDKMKYANRNRIYFNKTKEIYMDIELNNRVNDIIENELIDINIYFKFNNKEREFNIYKEKNSDKNLKMLDCMVFIYNNNEKLCRTIEEFTKSFPNLNKRISLEGQMVEENEIGIFNVQKELRIPENLKKFFNLVNEHLKNIIKRSKDLEIINEKIHDYVMSKIYYKIYPLNKHRLDDQIFQNICKVSWAEPNNIINSKTNFDLDLILPDINKYFQLIRKEKSPRKKIINLINIFISINNLLLFSGNTNPGVDDQMPILTYCFIKAKPKMIYTNCKFIELYIGNKKNKNEGNLLTQMITICDYFNKINSKSFYNISEEEFNRKTSLSLEYNI